MLLPPFLTWGFGSELGWGDHGSGHPGENEEEEEEKGGGEKWRQHMQTVLGKRGERRRTFPINPSVGGGGRGRGRPGGTLLCPQFHFSPALGGFFWLPLAKRARGEEQTFGNFRLLAVFFDNEKKANRRNPRFADAASQAVCMCTLPEEEK